jgi:hypothetical protein
LRGEQGKNQAHPRRDRAGHQPNGLITLEEALRRATNPDEFKLKIQGIQSTSDISREEMDGVLDLAAETALDPFSEDSPFEFGGS